MPPSLCVHCDAAPALSFGTICGACFCVHGTHLARGLTLAEAHEALDSRRLDAVRRDLRWDRAPVADELVRCELEVES